jgi:cytoskeletal protein CcmA (bactofilin family)
MGLFGTPTPKQSTGYSVINDRLVIRGELDTDGTVRVDGRVEGATHRAGTLIVGTGGHVVGNVEARDVIVAGVIQGNVHAAGRIQIEAGASVLGEIRANALVLLEGAMVHGLVSIGATPPAAIAAPHAGARRLELAALSSSQALSAGRRI